MYILRRLPLTTSALALFSAYTVVSVAVRKIKTYFATKKSAQEPFLLQDIQHEILKHIFEETELDTLNETHHQILELGLVCKDWFKFISHNERWFKYLEEIVRNSNRLEDLGDKDNQITDPIERLLGIKGVFSPKIMYYLFRRRIDQYYHGQKPRPTLAKLTPDLKSNKNNNKLWTPWLNHNILKAPEIIWKWLYTSIRYPRWIFPLVYDAYDEKKKYSIYADHDSANRVKKILFVLSIGLSVLPWADNMIWNSTDVIKEVISGKYYGLWMKNSWSLTAQIQSVSFLLWMQLFDNLHLSPSLIIVKGVLLLLTALFMRGLFPILVTAAFISATFGGFVFGVRKKIIPNFESRRTLLVVVLLVLSPLVYFYPGLLILGSTAFFAVLLDVFRQSRLNFAEQNMKFGDVFLGLAIGTIGWAALV